MQNKHLFTCIIITATALLLTLPVESALADSSKLDIVNLNGNYLTLTFEELEAMPKTIVNADLYCYGALVVTGDWGGVQVSYLLAQANATSEVGSITLVASDGYRASIPITLALAPNTIIAYEKDGYSLPEGLRLVLPDVNGDAWIAMITTLTTSTSGAQSPAGLSAGLPSGSSLAQSQNTLPQDQQQTPTPTPTIPTVTATPTLQPTIPANGAQQNQSPPTVQTQDGLATSQTLTLLVVAVGAVLCGVAIVSAFYVRKRKA